MHSLLPMLVAVSAMQAAEPLTIKTGEIEIDFRPRTPDQMASFYEARGFPDAMIRSIKDRCFITVGITNKSGQRIWLDLRHWTFTNAQGPIKRIDRKTWRHRWQTMNMPMNYQSTFRWTLIPEQLDYLPAEREGGNITLPMTKGYFSLTASFDTGDDRSGPVITVKTDRLYCAQDPAQ